MPSLPRISKREAIRALERLGFVVKRQRGSYVVLRLGSTGLVVPDHKELKIGTLNGVLKQAAASVDGLIAALKWSPTIVRRATASTSPFQPVFPR
jgi:predicted RNA binding protein YcfA (HicA-like mRNA interferase family)